MTNSNNLRIVSWNANAGVHTKLRFLEELKPDIAVVPECAKPEVLIKKHGPLPRYATMAWMGQNDNKGLAVFGYGDWHIREVELPGPKLEWILPITVEGPVTFNLLAVWASNHRATNLADHTDGLPQPRAALRQYRDFVLERPTVMAGDFNHNVIWDAQNRSRAHALTNAAASEANLFSAYHHWANEGQGEETKPTIHWRNRTIDGPSYHIDYVYLPNVWLPHLINVTIGDFDPWVSAKRSDHLPIVVDLTLG